MRKGLHLPLTFHFCLFLLLLWVLTPQPQEETLGLTGSGGGWGLLPEGQWPGE